MENRCFFLASALRNQETGHLFLNGEDELPESRVVIEKGVAWEYSNIEERESIQTTGPLKYVVLLMVSASRGESPTCSTCVDALDKPLPAFVLC